MEIRRFQIADAPEYRAFRLRGLRERLARYHGDVDGAFWQWNDVWLSEGFRSFDIRPDCSRITAPLLLIQGLDDAYGTLLDTRDAVQVVTGRGRDRLGLFQSQARCLAHCLPICLPKCVQAEPEPGLCAVAGRLQHPSTRADGGRSPALRNCDQTGRRFRGRTAAHAFSSLLPAR